MLFLMSPSLSALSSSLAMTSLVGLHFESVGRPYSILTVINKYLVHIINSDLTDDADMMRQTRAIYARANTIIRQFSFPSPSTKLMLFRAFCSPIYGRQLWCSMFQYSVNKLRVAYNDAFRQLLREPRWCSASRLFALNNVSSFAALMCKPMYSFMS